MTPHYRGAHAGAAAKFFTLDREISHFDVSPDGQRFLVIRGPEPGYAPFRVLVNWQAALK